MASSSFSMKAYEYTHTHAHAHAHIHRISAGIVCPRYTGFKTIRSTNTIVHTSFYNVKQCPKTPENIARSLIFKNDRVSQQYGKHIFRKKQKYHVPGVKRELYSKLSLKHFRRWKVTKIWRSDEISTDETFPPTKHFHRRNISTDETFPPTKHFHRRNISTDKVYILYIYIIYITNCYVE